MQYVETTHILSSLFNVLIWNIFNKIVSNLLLHEILPGNRKSWGTPTKISFRVESNPPPSVWAQLGAGLPYAHDIKRNHYSTNTISDCMSRSAIIANIISMSATYDLPLYSNSGQKVNPLFPVNVAVDQGEGNEGGKSSSDSASTSISSQTQRRRVSGRPSIRQGRSSALSPGNLGEDEDDDDDPVNSGKSAKPLSQC